MRVHFITLSFMWCPPFRSLRSSFLSSHCVWCLGVLDAAPHYCTAVCHLITWLEHTLSTLLLKDTRVLPIFSVRKNSSSTWTKVPWCQGSVLVGQEYAHLPQTAYCQGLLLGFALCPGYGGAPFVIAGPTLSIRDVLISASLMTIPLLTVII